jgi:hypothetical protein
MGSNHRRLAALAVVFWTALAAGGCSTLIVPPKVEPAAATQVMVADYGYHSTVIFPDSKGAMVEYAYGDWTYFSLNQKSYLNALRALLCSDQASLGRRVLTQPSDDTAAFSGAIGAKSVLKFDVPADKVRELERALDRRFAAAHETPFFSKVHNLLFVKDGEHYSVVHNCNHFTAENLEQLGCRVEGWALLSKFHLPEPDEGDVRPGATTRPATRPSSEARPAVH